MDDSESVFRNSRTQSPMGDAVRESLGMYGKLNRKRIEELYLDYFNNFLTVSRFAEYYGFTELRAQRIIDIGRKINHKKRV